MKKILSVFGTRPEAIKMAPIILKLRTSANFDSKVCVTGQHREMLDTVLESFKIAPDFDLSIMRSDQTLSYITQSVMDGIDRLTNTWRPDLILVHGDTTTAFATALTGFYKQIPVCHIEAGLRSNDILSPFPEEFNRRSITMLSSYHFAPTQEAYDRLKCEGIEPERIFLVGNSVIDALKLNLKSPCDIKLPDTQFLLMTVHRREHSDKEISYIFNAVKRILEDHPDITLIYPVHKNPRFQSAAKSILGNTKNAVLTDPMEVCRFHHALSKCRFVITDSGGIQEEATFLGKPVLVVRKNTERKEAELYGTLKLIGTDEKNIYDACSLWINDDTAYMRAAIPCELYGKGDTAEKIVNILCSI